MGHAVMEDLEDIAGGNGYRPMGRPKVVNGEYSQRARERIRDLLKQRRIPMDTFGRKALGLGLDATRNVLYGRTDLTVDRLGEIAKYLGVPYSFFVDDETGGGEAHLSIEAQALVTMYEGLSPVHRNMVNAIAATFERGEAEMAGEVNDATETAPE